MRTLSLAAAPLAVALILAGCTAEEPASDVGEEEVVEPPVPTVQLGVDWSEPREFTPPGDMRLDSVASASSAIWAIGPEFLRWTTDGREWQELDYAAAGLPDRVSFNAGSAREVAGGIEFFAKHAQDPRFWRVTVMLDGSVDIELIVEGFGPHVGGGPAGTTLSVSRPAYRLPLGDREISVSAGLWVVPFGSGYSTVSVIDTTDEWRMLVDGTSPLRSPDTAPGSWAVRATSSGGTLVVATWAEARGIPTTIHSSHDGVNWNSTSLIGQRTSSSPDIAAIAAGPSGFVALAAEVDGRTYVGPAVWFSVDGVDWEYHEVPPIGRGEPVHVVANGDGFIALGKRDLDSGDVAVWLSDDGRTWHAQPAGLGSLNRPPTYLEHEGSIILISSTAMFVSGEWGR